MSAATFPPPAAGHDGRGRYFISSQYATDGAAFGDTRGFSRLWDLDGAGSPKTTVPSASWSRGELVRSSQPMFVLTQLGPPLEMAGPAGWRPGL